MFHRLLPILQDSSSVSVNYSAEGQMGPFGTLVMLAIIVVMIAGIWKVFTKAGEPGWAALVPIYNIIVYLRIAGKPLWWIILFIIPFVNFIIALLVSLGLAKNFGKSTGFGIGLWLLSPIFLLILGFGDARYQRQAS